MQQDLSAQTATTEDNDAALNTTAPAFSEESEKLALLLGQQRDFSKIGTFLILVPILFGTTFCWERGPTTFLTLALAELALHLILNICIVNYAKTLQSFCAGNICRLTFMIVMNLLMYYCYGPFVPYHVFSTFRILIASGTAFLDNRLFVTITIGLSGSTLGGMYLAFVREKHLLTPDEEIRFYQRLIEVFTLHYTIFLGSFLFSLFMKKRYEEKHNTDMAIAREKLINNEKTQFIANLSHEARNSLQGIMATVEVLKHKFHDGVCMKSCEHCFKKDSAISELIGDIQSSASLLLHILSSSLQMSSLEMGKIKLKNEEFNILSLFESMTGVFSLEAQGKNLSLNSFFDASKVPLNLKGDSVRVSQILMNIISNAIKYTSQGFVRVNCTCVDEKELSELYNEIEEDKSYVKFECIDSGCGIAQDQIGKLFQPYHTIDPNTDVTHRFDFYFKTASNISSDNNAGSSLINTNRNGLGLNITKLLVEKMNGKIIVESVKGKGTTISVVIPLEIASNHAHSEDRSEGLTHKNVSQILEKPVQAGKKVMVYIIDEHKSFRDCLKAYLEIFKRVRSVKEFESVDKFLELFSETTKNFKDEMHIVFCHETEYEKISTALDGEPVSIILTVLRGSSRLFPNMNYLSKPILFGDLVAIFDDQEMVKQQNNIILEKRRSSLGELANKSVLLADDNAVNRKILVNMLKIIGFKDIDTANDGLDCFNKFKKKEYSLVLLDCFMPVMTGRESCEMIRNFEKQRENGEKRVPIFAITANTWETKEQLLSQGFDDVLYKPISVHDLRQRIHEAVTCDKR
ncbi:hypothetical protein C9374_011030 [Naegleria lovaniensis]|uniref:Histidine kinase n=1 Tax=Naegleria lovaniensis TaxID=51637 RepID=A0AA88KDJ8_NAELO|nr:uncharacterized protein C9374_011030 [Naegleria lovaniensis]KAG2374193.1 hypothetical protein C9374_011030 [Naegleria lovaniensis]